MYNFQDKLSYINVSVKIDYLMQLIYFLDAQKRAFLEGLSREDKGIIGSNYAVSDDQVQRNASRDARIKQKPRTIFKGV